MVRFLQRLALGCWYTFAALVVLAAVLLSLARLLLPFADRYRGDVEAWASIQLRQPVRIGTIDAAWQGLGPVLKLQEVRLLDRQGVRTVLELDELRLGISLLDILRTAQIRPDSLQVVGARLTIERRADGSLVLQGVDLADTTASRGDAAGASGWLLGMERLGLLDSEIVWHDRQTGAPPLRFPDVALVLDNEGARHRLHGKVNFPARQERRFEFVFEFEGDLAAPAGWVGKLYAVGADVPLEGWPVALPGGAHMAGAADFELWTDWREAQPVKVQGTVGIRNLAVASSGDAPVAVDQIQGQVLWAREASGWRLDVTRCVVRRGARSWPESRVSVAAVTDAEGRLGSARVQADYVAVEDAVALVQPFAQEPLREILAEVRPYGELRDLDLAYQSRGEDEAPAFAVRTRFMQVGGYGWGKFPAVSGLSGTLEADEASGNIMFDSRMVRVELAYLFRHAIEAARVYGRLGWERGQEGWRLYTDELAADNADIKTRSRMALTIPHDGGRPFLDMQTAFQEGDASHAYRYLPVGIMPPEVVKWLDRALVSGRVTSGTLLFHGHPQDFPFDGGTGKFEVRFAVADAVLDYEEGWPRLEELEAEVVFSGRSMAIQAVGGKLYNADLLRAEAVIPDLHRARLGIDGQVRGPVSDMLRVLREGPLAAQYGGYLEGVRAGGNALLDLDLALDLRKGGKHRIAGKVDFRDATLAADRWDVTFTQVNGPLRFSDTGLAAQALTARLFGQKIRVRVDTIDAGAARGRPATDITIAGPDLLALAKQFQIGLPAGLRGSAAWEARLRVPAGAEGWRNAAVNLVLRSDLAGLAIPLPAPLAKPQGQPRELTIRMPLTAAEARVISIRYGESLAGVLEVRRGAGGMALQRGELRLGGGEPELPRAPGLRITGRLEYLPLDAWRGWLARPDAAGQGAALAGQLSLLQLDIGRLESFGRTFEDLKVVAQRDAAAWGIRVEGADATGVIRVPYRPAGGTTVTMDFEHLYLRAARTEAGDGGGADPRHLPPLQVTSKRLVYQGSDLGALELKMSPRPDGTRLEQLLLQSPALRIVAHGDWTSIQGRQSSSFAITLDSTDLAQAMRLLGYAAAVDGPGPGRMEISANWPGAPAQFDLARLDGQLYMRIGKGQLLEVNPGMGRVFGLFSLHALPRRLSLDFRDLLGKGFAFDRIEGHFRIVDGDAYTHDLYMDGPAAYVEVMGRTGLGTRDYDQVVTVVPRVGSSLPLAGALAGGPGVGVALMLVEKLFRTQINQAARVQYTVTGSWDEPVVERVQLAAEDWPSPER